MDFLYKQVQRCNRNLLFLCILFIAFSILINIIPIHDYLEFQKPPEKLDMEKALSKTYLTGLMSKYYYIDKNEYVDIGSEPFTLILAGNKELKVDRNYILVKNGEYWVPVDFHGKEHKLNDKISGKLSDIADSVFDELKARAAELHGEKLKYGTIIPVSIDTNAGYDFWLKVTLIIAFVFLMFSVIGILKIIRRKANPNNSPIIKKLLKYGDIHYIVNSFNREFGKASNFKKVIVTYSWYVGKRTFTVDIAPNHKIIWAYTVSKWKKAGIFIPIYRVTELNVILDDGTNFKSRFIRKKSAEKNIDRLKKYAPWIVTGYNAEIKKEYETNFERFVATVEQSRETIKM